MVLFECNLDLYYRSRLSTWRARRKVRSIALGYSRSLFVTQANKPIKTKQQQHHQQQRRGGARAGAGAFNVCARRLFVCRHHSTSISNKEDHSQLHGGWLCHRCGSIRRRLLGESSIWSQRQKLPCSCRCAAPRMYFEVFGSLLKSASQRA